jgi:hypothetical protein
MAISNLVCGRDGHNIAQKGTCDHYSEREEITKRKGLLGPTESK